MPLSVIPGFSLAVKEQRTSPWSLQSKRSIHSLKSSFRKSRQKVGIHAGPEIGGHCPYHEFLPPRSPNLVPSSPSASNPLLQESSALLALEASTPPFQSERGAHQVSFLARWWFLNRASEVTDLVLVHVRVLVHDLEYCLVCLYFLVLFCRLLECPVI